MSDGEGERAVSEEREARVSQERMLASKGRPERILDKPAGCLLCRRKRDSCGGTTGWWPSGHCPSFQMIKIQTI